MALDLMLRPIMPVADCRRLLKRANCPEFKEVIVYLPRYQRSDGSWTSDNGLFQEFNMAYTFWGTDQDDWHLDEDMVQNDFGTFTKSVYVSFDDQEYMEAFLYCRVRKATPYRLERDVMNQLNKHLDMFRDDLRTGIAQEWSAQEPWRILPLSKEACIAPIRGDNGEIIAWTYPAHNIVAVMKENLPQGYGEDLPAGHVIH